MHAKSIVSTAVVTTLLAGLTYACSTASIRDGFGEDDDQTDLTDAAATSDGADNDNGPGFTGGQNADAPPPMGPGDVDLNAVTPCDVGLSEDGDVEDFLKAIGLCTWSTSSDDWGVIEARFTRGIDSSSQNTNAGQRGVLPKFGDVLTPREGGALGVLSTGYAREYNTLGSQRKAFNASDSQAWGGLGDFGEERQDQIALRLTIRVPTNAKGFSFDFNFHSSEWPNYIGSDYNDEFRVNLDGQNIAFDSNSRPVNVNNGFFEVCKPNARVGCQGTNGTSVCPLGTGELDGTGFGMLGSGCSESGVPRGGATGWLTTTAPVEPGSTINLDFAIWDASDGIWDSSVLIDNFRWDADEVVLGTGRPN